MTKREAILSQRLAAAHRFIAAMRNRCEDYGSQLSASITVDCESFLRDNKPRKESAVVVVPLWRYKRLMQSRLSQIKAGKEAKP